MTKPHNNDLDDTHRPQPSRRSEIDNFLVMEVMRAAANEEKRGRNVIHMEVGQPGTPAPRKAREALEAALNSKALGYTLATGMLELRERIARHYLETYNIKLDAQRVIVTSGSSAAFVLAFLAAFDDGDHIGLPNPGYPCYRQIASALGLHPKTVTTHGHSRWMPTAKQIDEAIHQSNIRGLLIASPANPTGTMITPTRLEELTTLCALKQLWFISDEIYHGLTYDGTATCALEFNNDAIIINSFSKYYSMTGWRIGWMIVPDSLIEPVERLAQNLYISPSAASQVAALAAFDAIEELELNKAAYARNREVLLNELPKLGFKTFAPADGAFYLYSDISHLCDNSADFAQKMLEDIAVATTPGIDFDAVDGKSYLRFSYAGTHENILEAIKRIEAWPHLRSLHA